MGQIFCVYQNEIIDLLNKSNTCQEKYIYNLVNVEQKILQAEIRTVADFRSLYRQAINQLVQIVNSNNISMENISLFVKLMVNKNKN